ncbi:peptidoglycan recognition protein 3-like [Sitodiplosis mosellana]|uniref:peptidoglycan recognition protein 3-like n=1 Tax=Sitodiplosis mosellana TaxID=263140 RepID=UPI0024448FDD|nr:peptidoglycan recognition protein 3-like [Sitodiplosis mosellana]
MDEISYNFLVGSDGYGYDGRGWDVMGNHTEGHNAKTICITFIGNFSEEPPPAHQLKAANKLRKGAKLGKINSEYKLFGLSPGPTLYGIIQTWDHWSSETCS